jgi:putative ABC transport system permease protein
VPAPLGPTVVRELPQVEQYTRFRWHGSLLIKKGDENVRESKVVYADSTLLNVFSLKLISGSQKDILNAPLTLLITESTARKYFNRTDVAGETLLIDNDRNY